MVNTHTYILATIMCCAQAKDTIKHVQQKDYIEELMLEYRYIHAQNQQTEDVCHNSV